MGHGGENGPMSSVSSAQHKAVIPMTVWHGRSENTRADAYNKASFT